MPAPTCGKSLLASETITASGGLEINVDHGENGALVRLSGRLHIDSSPALRERLLAILQAKPPEAITVDLTDVLYVDLSGVATLIEALKIARNRKSTLRLEGLHGPLLHQFEVTGLLALFEATGHASALSVSKVL
jgi:anti-sigma B factor antagonist